jgi:hypothetical protein
MEPNNIQCNYGCENEGTYILKNGKRCCHESSKKCPAIILKSSEGRKGAKRTLEQKHNISISHIGQKSFIKGLTYDEMYGKEKSESIKEKMRNNKVLTLQKIKEKYSFLFLVEEIIEDPKNKLIKVHCKFSDCENSKEKGGWFTPSYTQIYERHRALTKPANFEENNFYCSDKCKTSCILYGKVSDPLNNLGDYKVFRNFVLKRDNYICQFCGEKATDVHHERPQKLEPFFALDPDFAWSCCKKCHYSKGHKDECNTWNLSQISC